MVTDWVAAQKMRWYAAVEAGLPLHASAHHDARPSFPTGTPRWRRACLRRRPKTLQWALRGVCQAKAPTAVRRRWRRGGRHGSSRWALSALCWRYARFKTPFFLLLVRFMSVAAGAWGEIRAFEVPTLPSPHGRRHWVWLRESIPNGRRGVAPSSSFD